MSGEKIALESAVNDVADMARLAVEFIGQGLKLDEKEPPKLVEGEVHLLMFALYQTQEKAEAAKAAFYAMSEARLI